jgi:mRNA-degrading endonuclease RelE of RelBE toxin-antitoxin system
MISHTTERFRKLYESLPKQIREQANQAYSQFKKDPYYPGLHFKRIHSSRPIYSVRITKDYRAAGVQQDNEIIWFWIGSHSDYDKLMNQLKHA